MGRRSFVTYARVPRRNRRRVTLVVSFRDRRGRLVQRLRVRSRAGVTRRLRLTVAGLSGRYRYTVRLGDRGPVLRRSSFRIRRDENTRVALREGQTLVCQIR